MAALSRMANHDHVIRITEGDTVLRASSLIPGNENAIYRVIDELTRWGANVVHKGNAKVHVSGHASAGELVYCYNLVRPRNVMPVHGEWRHLRANGDLAIRTGIDPKRVVLAEDGVVVDLVKGRASITGRVPAGNVYVDGATVGGATEAHLKDRRNLAEEGVITVVAIVDPDTGKLAEPPDFLARGFVHDERTFEPVEALVQEALARAAKEGVGGATQLEQLIARAVARWAPRTYRRSPMIIPSSSTPDPPGREVSARFEELDRSPTPIGEVSLRSRRHPAGDGDIYEVKLGDEYLMSSLFTVAEVAVASLAWTGCPAPG